jgi:hypothetical protein|tara:strand:+ start:1154 stop:1444 length:291 start_codon:yes stop_codon:yes gene_type:complete
MDIQDAEYQEWFNAPKIGYWTKKPLDNKEVLCEYWSLKNDEDVLVIGTELQCYNLFSKMLKEEGWQLNFDYQDELLPEYLEAYKNNNNKPLIINLK